jgi:HEAT repeat protein
MSKEWIDKQRAGERRIKKLEAEHDVSALLLALREYPMNAASALGRLKDPDSVAPLVSLLADQEQGVRRWAAEALGYIGDPRAIQALLPLLADQAAVVRAGAAEALGMIGDPRAIEALVPLLEDMGYSVRQRTAYALKQLGWQPSDDKERVNYLLGMTMGKTGWDKLVEVGPPAVEPLMRLLKGESGAEEAAKALGMIGDPRAVEPLIELVEGKYEQYYESPGYHDLVRIFAVKALDQIGDGRAEEPLISALTRSENNAFIRENAAGALGRLKARRALDPLVRALNDREASVQRVAAKALAAIGDRRALEALVAKARNPRTDPETREAVVRAIGQLGTIETIDTLFSIEGCGLKVAAAAIADIKEGALERCIARLGSPIARSRAIAVLALDKLNDERALEPLTGALKDPEPGVVYAALGALSRIGGQGSIISIMECLSHAKPLIRGQAATVLGDFGDARAVEPLIAALADADWTVRNGAVIALGKIGDRRAVPALERAIKDGYGPVVISAKGALMAIESKQSR